ncbi:MAG: hypothetical protein HQM08_30420 [Candidatus Riflebacteria bacterium]|nr:hypothetical protein [Candidatus Riflebacteria bacterium]
MKKFLELGEFAICVFFTIVIEFTTILFRFVFHLQATRDTKSFIAPLTFGIRIHHGYLGIVLWLFSYFVKSASWKNINFLKCAGISLFFSDLIHHFVVLFYVEGSPGFDIFY